jgi:tetratricopeptide (TPR) repeat protein
LLRAGRYKLLITLGMLALAAGCAHVPAPDSVPEPAAVREQDPRLLMMLARYEENQGHWQQALEHYAKVDDPVAWLARARISYILNDADTALNLVDRLIEADTFVGESLEIRTKIYARKGDWHQAIKDTEALVQRYPDHSQIKLFLANLRIIVSDFTGAEELLRGMPDSEENISILYTLSKACLGNKDLACARESLLKVLEINPRFLPAYLDLGKVYELSGDTAMAESSYQQHLELEPDSVEALIALSDLYFSTGRYRESISTMERLRQLSSDPRITRKLVLLQIREGMYEEAITNIASLPEKDVEDVYYLAIAYARLGRLEQAYGELSGISLEGRLGCEAVLLRSSILKDLDRSEEAIEELFTAWRHFSAQEGCLEAGYQLATELDLAGRRDEGLEIANQILENDPSDPVALNFVGYVWADESINLEQAREMIGRALSQRPDDPYILDSMAWVLFRMNEPEKALTYLEKAVQKLDNDPTIHEHMGEILLSLGKRDRALDHFLKAVVFSRNASDELRKKIDELFE